MCSVLSNDYLALNLLQLCSVFTDKVLNLYNSNLNNSYNNNNKCKCYNTLSFITAICDLKNVFMGM